MPKRETTLGKLLLQQVLPQDLYADDMVLDKKGVSDLLSKIGRQYPDRYREISHQLAKIGHTVSYETGGNSFGLDHLTTAEAAVKHRNLLQNELNKVLSDNHLTEDQRNKRIIELTSKASSQQETEVLEESLKQRNPLALQLKGAGRGNPTNLASLRASDMLYTDHKGNTIPIPITRSYSEGLDPASYFAGAYGARKSVLDTKLMTADSGFLAKQLAQAAHRLIVTDVNSPDDDDDYRGLPVDTDDKDNEGALLSRPAGSYGRNTILTPKILNDLKERGVKRILVRSPAVRGSPEGGVYAVDVGVREHGSLPGRGTHVGMTASQALSEPLSQAMLCLAAGTLVRMADGSAKAIENIVVGDMVLGSDTKGVVKPVQVVNTYQNGVKPCVETSFTNPRKRGEVLKLLSTPDHKLLAIRMASNCADEKFNNVPRILPVGYPGNRFSAVLPETAVRLPQVKSFDSQAFLLGVLLGDGCYTESVHGVYFSCADESLIQDMIEPLAELNLKIVKMAGHDIYYRISTLNAVTTEKDELGRFVSGARNPAVRLLTSLNMLGKYAHEKTIPVALLTASDSYLASLLAGLFVTDGSIYLADRTGIKPYLNFASTSYTMAKQVQTILEQNFYVYTSKIHKNTSDRKRPLYSFTITSHSSVQKFLKTIPLLGIKAVKAREWVGNFVPKKNADFQRCRRLSQFSVGDLPTYDIEVDNEDHLFVLANGLIVSNSSKHAGGVASASATKTVGGFDAINQLIQVPEVFRGGAAHSTLDGVVTKIEAAPAGGNYVYVGNERHYAAEGLPAKVKVGDKVEAGDVLSEGMPNPAMITAYKGIGEGRRYFVKSFRDTYKNAGIKAHRRNIELLSRGLINHVRLTEELGNYVPDDVVPYSTLEHNYEPRDGFEELDPKLAVDKYLEKPVLHYSIGTKIRPSMLQDFQEFGVPKLTVHKNPPPFEPEMIRGMQNLKHDQDWMTRMLGSGLKGSFTQSVQRGATSDPTGTSFVPALAQATTFGRQGLIKTPEPNIAPQELPDILKKPKKLF